MKIELNITDLAKSLANSDARRQAEFFNEFSRELKFVCKDLDLSGNQPYWISNNLDSNGLDLIKSLHEFILLREATEPK